MLILDGYNVIFDGSPIGVAVVVKNFIEYTRFSLNNIGFNCSLIQINLKSNNRKKILAGSIYVPCNYTTQLLLVDLDKLLEFTGRFDGFIIGGDLNAGNHAWSDSLEKMNGKNLNWLVNNSIYVVLICDATPSFAGVNLAATWIISPIF